MPTCKTITIIPLRTLCNQFYWWSSQREAPYRIGAKGKDWAGPFLDTLSAIAHSEKVHEGEDVILDHTVAELSDVPWPERRESFNLHFALPLDEYSERIFLAEPGSAERSAFLHALIADVDLAPTLDEADFLITYSALAKSHLSADEILNGKAFFEIPVHITYLSMEAVHPGKMQRLVKPCVSIQGLYDQAELDLLAQPWLTI